MARVFLPPRLRKLAGAESLDVAGGTVREVLTRLADDHPDLAEQLLSENQLAPELQLSVATVMTRKLTTPVEDHTEIHFLPAIGGG